MFSDLESAVEKAAFCKEFCFCVRIVRLEDEAVLYSSLSSSEADVEDLGADLKNSEEAARNCHRVCVGKNQEAFEIISVPLLIENQRCALELIQPHNRIISVLTGEPATKDRAGRYITDTMNDLLLKDTLTGLYNRRYIDECLPAALNEAYAREQPLSILFADIDRFKLVNDNYGHLAGDLVLQHVAQLLQKQVRRTDSWVARYGGDEFVICLPGVDQAAARRIANRLRVAIMSERFVLEGGVVSLTCSFGVQSMEKSDMHHSAQMLLHGADEKLYQAKRAGRNAVV
jgi:diguanylate cyclase (GGDEF)-like protein